MFLFGRFTQVFGSLANSARFRRPLDDGLQPLESFAARKSVPILAVLMGEDGANVSTG